MKRLRVTFIAASFVELALVLWSRGRLPARVPLHWNLAGEVDRSGSPATLLFGGAAVLLALWVVAELARFVDPKLMRGSPLRNPSDDDEPDHERFSGFAAAIGIAAGLVAAVQSLIGAQAAGVVHEGRRGIALLLAAFAIVLGNVIGRVRPNWFVGVRTPWTLSSDVVWRRTHRLAGRLMVPAGFLAIACALVLPGAVAFPAAVGLLVAALLVPAVFSYAVFRAL